MISVHECPLASSEGKEKGGINVYVFELSKALSKIGYSIDIFTRTQDTINPRIVLVYNNLRVIHLPAGPLTAIPKKDVINHLDEFAAHMYELMQTEHLSYDLIHAHYYYSGVVAHTLRTVYNNPSKIIMSFHTLGLMKQLVSRSELSDEPKIRISMEQKLVKNSDFFVTSSDNDTMYLSSLYDCPQNKITSIPPGVDTILFRPKNQKAAKIAIGADPDHRIIVAVGRIDPIKGFDVLLFALKILLTSHPELSKNICLWIVGGDVGEDKSSWSTELQSLDRLQMTLGLATSVRFVTAKPQEKLPDYYNAADVVVMPSHYESFGMVALEALACGTSIIATDVTGISPMLKTFPKGHVISANNPIKLAEELYRVTMKQKEHHLNPKDLSALDWSTMATKMKKVYESVQK